MEIKITNEGGHIESFNKEACPLCTIKRSSLFHQDKRRPYLRCSECSLVYVPKTHLLGLEEEKAIYDLHQNDGNDQGYQKFLSRCLDPVKQRLLDGHVGLDFGCGPGPVLADMFSKEGWSVSVYDPIYFPKEELLSQQYDFITATEVIEHVYSPKDVLPLLIHMLKPEGILALMTKRVLSREAFSTWHYKNDQTHVCFYSEETFRWIANRYQLSYEFVSSDVVLLSK